jgi:hypothetical protein
MSSVVKYSLVFALGAIFAFSILVGLGRYYEAMDFKSEDYGSEQLYELRLLEELFKEAYCSRRYTAEIVTQLNSLALSYTSMSENPQIGEGLEFDLMLAYARLSKIHAGLGNPNKSRKTSLLAAAYYQISSGDIRTQEDIFAHVESLDEAFCRAQKVDRKKVDDFLRKIEQ